MPQQANGVEEEIEQHGVGRIVGAKAGKRAGVLFPAFSTRNRNRDFAGNRFAVNKTNFQEVIKATKTEVSPPIVPSWPESIYTFSI